MSEGQLEEIEIPNHYISVRVDGTLQFAFHLTFRSLQPVSFCSTLFDSFDALPLFSDEICFGQISLDD